MLEAGRSKERPHHSRLLGDYGGIKTSTVANKNNESNIGASFGVYIKLDSLARKAKARPRPRRLDGLVEAGTRRDGALNLVHDVASVGLSSFADHPRVFAPRRAVQDQQERRDAHSVSSNL